MVGAEFQNSVRIRLANVTSRSLLLESSLLSCTLESRSSD